MNDLHDSSSSRVPRRTEPVLGDLDQIDPGDGRHGRARGEAAAPAPERPSSGRPESRHAQPARPRRGMPWAALVVVLVLVGAGAWAWTHQVTLRGWLPQTQLNSLLTRADSAYTAGKLTGGPDSARDLYEAARAIDPDNEQARTGLQNVGNAELARARAALRQRDYQAAGDALEEARSLLGGGAAVEAVDQALAKAVLQHANVDVMVNQGREALANGRIDGKDGAAALFGKVLAGDPDNPVARHGMDQIGNLLAGRIQGQLGSGDRKGAHQTLSNLASLLPGYAQLPSLRAAVATADRTADAARDELLAKGESDLHAGRITGSGDDNAEAEFKAALAADPGNARAEAGLGQVAEALIMQANAAIDSGHPHDANALLERAAALAPKSADLAAARSRLAATAKRGEEAAPTPAVTPAQSAQVARLVARAHSAARKGDIMLPPGDSAYDLYRSALNIDGNDAAAQAGLRALPQFARTQFRQALGNGNLEHAHDMLATLEQLDPGDPAAAQMQHQLGRAWLDRADRDVRLGRVAAARTALAEAQRLVPEDPRISEVDARIRQDN